MNCPKCGSRIVTYKDKKYCLRRPTKNKQVEINDPPTEIEYFKNTKIIKYKRWKNKKGELHREGDKPAFIEYNKDGTICTKIYYINGKRNRDNDKPAYISYHENGQIMEKAYYINGRQHRDNGKPACITYYPPRNENPGL